jgi:hypothetical protein
VWRASPRCIAEVPCYFGKPFVRFNLPGGSINTHECANGSVLVRADAFFRSALLAENFNSESHRTRYGVRRQTRSN